LKFRSYTSFNLQVNPDFPMGWKASISLTNYAIHDDAAPLLGDGDSQSSHVASRDITPDTSVSQRIEERAFKMSKKRRQAVGLH
jgi:hypothetical protein